MITKRDLPCFIFADLIIGTLIYILSLDVFGEPLPFQGDRLWRLCITFVFPGLSLAILGYWGGGTSWLAVARKWLSIGLLGAGLILSAFIAFLVSQSVVIDYIPYIIAVVFTVGGWWLSRGFWKPWRLLTLLTLLIVNVLICYHHSMIFWRPWRVSQAIISDTDKVELLHPIGHAYQFYIIAFNDDHIDVRINVNSEGSGSITAIIYRLRHPKGKPYSGITEEYHEQLDRAQVTQFLEQIKKVHFWGLTDSDMGGMNYGKHIWLMNGVRDGHEQELNFRCPDLLSKSPPEQLERDLFDLGLLFVRLARAPYPKRILIGESPGERSKWKYPL